METVDTLIHARWIIPVEPQGLVLDYHSLAVKDGRIAAILPQHEAHERYKSKQTHVLDSHALIPGLINTHTHAAMTLFRGLADDMPLMEWLNKHIWPAEATWVDYAFVKDGAQLAIAEMIRCGTTCFNDMYFFPDETARVASQCGIRANIGMIVIDFPTVWAKDSEEYMHKGLEVHDYYRNHPLIKTTFAPHAPYTVSDEPLKKLITLADELEIPIHMHIHETEDEINQSLSQHRSRPLQRMESLGLLSPRLMAVHMTQLTEHEIQRLVATSSHVVHCPESNLKLASGFCPVAKLLDAGVNVALGTDGSASNNDLDMLGEMKTAALLGKAVAKDASAVSAEQALSMATINGAKALGLEHNIGSLVVGKAADITAIDLGHLESQPIYHPISHIVYASSRHQVTDVWVNGNQLLRQRALTHLDETAIMAKTRQWQDKILKSDIKAS
jgi:5-methylthioadenosine/S-adenosylhomocysteine deaminase